MDHSSRTENDYREERDIADRRLENYREPLTPHVSSITGRTIDLTISSRSVRGRFELTVEEALELQKKLATEIASLRKFQKGVNAKVSSLTKRKK